MDCSLPGTNVKILVKAIHSLGRVPGEDLYLEATKDGLRLRTVNTSRSAYLCFHFKPQFFTTFQPATVNEETGETERSRRVDRDESEMHDDRTTANYCKIGMKSALIVYKAVLTLEKVIESGSIAIDPNEWKLIFRLNCNSGVRRVFRLSLLNCASMHVLLEKKDMPSSITIPGKLFMDGIQHNFQSNQDEVTMTIDRSDFDLRNYIDDVPNPEKLVKTQLHLQRDDFEHFSIRNNADITFCMKELRAFLVFVEAYLLPIVIRFDGGGKPLIFSLESDPAFTVDLLLATFSEQGNNDENNGENHQPPMEQGIGEQQQQQSDRPPENNAPQTTTVDVRSQSEPTNEETDQQREEYPPFAQRLQESAAATQSVNEDARGGTQRIDHGLRNTPSSVTTMITTRIDSDPPAMMDVDREEHQTTVPLPSQPESPAPPSLLNQQRRSTTTSNLFSNWGSSQSTTISESQFPLMETSNCAKRTRRNENRVVLAPDSDLEDY